MINNYSDIQGWCDFEDLYDTIANTIDKDQIFVEVGVWKGRSICFLGEAIKRLSKTNKIFAVDTFLGFDNEDFHQEEVAKNNGTLFDLFLQNIKDLSLNDIITPIQKASTEAAKDFKTESIDFIFIDANHEYSEVTKDIQAWFPKLKKGGSMLGHDFWADDVKRAVLDFFNSQGIQVNSASQSCWIIKK